MPRLLTVTVEHGGQRFDFQLHERELLFGRAGVGRYFWMDGRQFRQGNAGLNFRVCVDLWWELVIAAGAHRQHDKEMTLVFAECYPLVNTARSLQDIYLDAQLHHSADREYSFVDEDQVRQRRAERTYLLPEDEVDRLRAIARTRDSNQVRAELEELFLGELPPRSEMPAFDEAARSWIGNGIVALRTSGREGLQRYVQSVGEWIDKLRRRGGIERTRTFLNMFGYECKIAYYHCYANAWVGILQSLKQNGDLGSLDERFMRIWHHQNRATAEDEVKRDVFCGQVLALHPLSAIVLTSPQHLEVIARCIGLANYDHLSASGRIVESPEYWDLVAAVLIAAHEYKQSHARWEEKRGNVTRTDSDEVARHARDDAMGSAQLLFDNYIAGQNQRCLECGGSLSYAHHRPAENAESPATATFRCLSCGHETNVEVRLDDCD